MAALKRRSSRWLAAGLAVSVPAWLTAIGCNNLVGIEPAQLDTASGGSSSSGGSGNGTGGGEPTCADFETTDVNLVRGCALRVSCDPTVPYYTMSDCVTYAYQLANPYEACTYGATSCAEVEECLGRRTLEPTSCTETGWECAENEAIRCGASEAYAFDCATVGSSCSEPDGFPDTGTAPCLVSNDPCTTDLGAWHCEGDMLYTCIDGVRYGRYCSATAATCVETMTGQGTCIDSTTRCTNLGALTCNGNVLSFCGTSGIRTVLDCGTAGLRCGDGDFIDCLAPGCNAEDVGSCTESCDGTILRYCVGGSPQQIDCTELGFASCQERSAGDHRVVHCSHTAPPGDDSCIWAHDDVCDQPPICAEGTDTTDCTNFPPPPP